MYPTHAVSTTTTIKSSLHKIHSCAYCTYANQAYYSQLRMLLSDNQKTIRRWASTKCTPVYITHQMNAQRARLRPAYYSLATAGGANKIRSSTWVLSDTNKLATVQPHSAVHEQTASLQPHPKGLPMSVEHGGIWPYSGEKSNSPLAINSRHRKIVRYNSGEKSNSPLATNSPLAILERSRTALWRFWREVEQPFGD